MTIERRNPVPKGRYWVDIIDTKSYPGARLFFVAWLARNRGKVEVVKKESFGALITGAARDWYLFDVKLPVEWEKGQGFGLPTIVRSAENPTAPVVTKPEDTATKPPPAPSFSEQLSEMFADAKSIAFIAIAIYAFSKMGNGKR
jgi:hypothetical protein